MLGVRPVAKRISSTSISSPSSRVHADRSAATGAAQFGDGYSDAYLHAGLGETATDVLADERLHPRQQSPIA